MNRLWGGTVVVVAAALANGQAYQADLFSESIPADDWPSDPNNPIRRVDSVTPANSSFVWERSGPPPYSPPAGLPPSVTRVASQEFVYGDRWDPVRPGCRYEEIYFDFTISFEDGSRFFYQIMIRRDWCPGPNGMEMVGFTRSILKTATDPLGDRAVIGSSVLQRQHGQTVTDTRHRAVNIPPGRQATAAPGLSNIQANEQVTIRAGTGGVVDLRNQSATLCTTLTPAVIKADVVLTDPGVTVQQLFSPAPLLTAAENRVQLRAETGMYPLLPAPTPDLVQFTVINVGNVPAATNVAWTDSLGWAPAGSIVETFEPGVERHVPVPVVYPPTGISTDYTTYTLTATPLSTMGGPVQVTQDVYFVWDVDGDGIKNSIDPCPFQFNSPSFPDTDGDFVPNECDPCPGEYNFFAEEPCSCYANCDGSSGSPRLTANDFQCFMNAFTAGWPYANCDGSVGMPALTANDFQCFFNRFAAGCGR